MTRGPERNKNIGYLKALGIEPPKINLAALVRIVSFASFKKGASPPSHADTAVVAGGRGRGTCFPGRDGREKCSCVNKPTANKTPDGRGREQPHLRKPTGCYAHRPSRNHASQGLCLKGEAIQSRLILRYGGFRRAKKTRSRFFGTRASRVECIAAMETLHHGEPELV